MSNAFASENESSSDAVEVTATVTLPVLNIPDLFRQHQQHLFRFVRRYLHNNEDAEDVVQNTFIEAMRCADKFSGLSKPSTWLFGIALNLARNQVRRNCNDLLEMADETFMNQVVDEHADPAKLLELRQIVKKVNTLLSNFPSKTRTTFEAVLDGETTYKGAAQELGIPIGTVRSRVSRVRASVRSSLE